MFFKKWAERLGQFKVSDQICPPLLLLAICCNGPLLLFSAQTHRQIRTPGSDVTRQLETAELVAMGIQRLGAAGRFFFGDPTDLWVFIRIGCSWIVEVGIDS